MEVRTLEPEEHGQWQDVVARAPAGSSYCLPAYLEALCSVTGGRWEILGAFDDSRLVGGAVAYQERHGLGFRVVGSRYLLYYSGIVLDLREGHVSSVRRHNIRILQALKSALDELDAGRIHLVNRHPLDDLRAFQAGNWQVGRGYSFEVDLAGGREILAGFSRNLRRLVRRAERQDLVFVDDLPFRAFADLHRLMHETRGTPLYLPLDDFERFYEMLRDAGLARVLGVTTSDGRPASVQLVLLGPHRTCHALAAASNAELFDTGVSPFMRWQVFQWLAQRGYEAMDLTDASLNDVTKFKCELGGRLVCNSVLVRKPRPLDALHQRVSRRWDRHVAPRLARLGP